MHCVVYRTDLREYTYIYLLEGKTFDDLPAALVKVFGQPERVMELVLTPQRKLANADINEVLHNLATRGYHLQYTSEDPSGWLDLSIPE